MFGFAKTSFRLPAFVAGPLVAVVFAAGAASGQEQPVSDAFVQKTESPHISTEISVAAEIVMEPGLGSEIVSGSVGTARKLAQSAAEDSESVPEFFRPYLLDETWDVTYSSDRHLSVLGTRWMFTGGAHGNTGYMAIIWQRDGDGGKEVPVQSLFVDGESVAAPVWPVLMNHLYAQWEAEWVERVGSPMGEDDQTWRDDARKTLTYRPDGYLTVTLLPSTVDEKSAGLAFHYPPYALGPYAMGTFSFEVPHAVFADYLTDDAKDVFAGTIPPAPKTSP